MHLVYDGVFTPGSQGLHSFAPDAAAGGLFLCRLESWSQINFFSHCCRCQLQRCLGSPTPVHQCEPHDATIWVLLHELRQLLWTRWGAFGVHNNNNPRPSGTHTTPRSNLSIQKTERTQQQSVKQLSLAAFRPVPAKRFFLGSSSTKDTASDRW